MAAGLIAVALALSLPDSDAASSLSVVAVDADPRGNGPRAVASTEECVSATTGQPVEIDIVLPSPGVPADRGIAAYQFSLFYDPSVVWVAADASGLLLAQAPGSNPLPISDPKPDRNGVYISWAVDFGPKGIEPAGASEAGPGVIARLTLLPKKNGASALNLTNVIIIDDASKVLSVESVRSGAVRVGEPCAGQNPSPTPATPTPAPTLPTITTVPAPSIKTFIATGGAPPTDHGGPWWLIAVGLSACLGGAALFIASAE